MILPLIQPPAHDHRPATIRAPCGQVPAMACGASRRCQQPVRLARWSPPGAAITASDGDTAPPVPRGGSARNRCFGIHGARGRRKRPRTTVPGDPAGMPQDLLERGFYGTAPNRRWVADITYVPVVAADFVYTAFVMDLFA